MSAASYPPAGPSSNGKRPRSASPAVSRSQSREFEDGADEDEEGDEDGQQEEDKPHRDGEGGKAAPGKRACARCRQIKVKCVPDEASADDQCTRCNRLDLDCVWLVPQKRGRKVKGTRYVSFPFSSSTFLTFFPSFSRSRLAAEAAVAPPPQTDPATAPSPSDPDRFAALLAATAIPQLAYPIPSNPLPPPPLPPVSLPPITSTSHQPFPRLTAAPPLYPVTSQPFHPSPQNLVPSPLSSTSRSVGRIAYSTPGSLLDTESPRPSLPSLSMMELASAKEQALNNLSTTGNAAQQPRREPAVVALREPDPVDMHILSEFEAAQLFEQFVSFLPNNSEVDKLTTLPIRSFHSNLNAFIILLDPVLHNVDYVRRTSTVLFTSILAVSAKFLRRDLYQPLLQSAKQLVGRGIIDGKVSVGLIQSILLQVYYKEPEDTSAWLRVGLAIRIGACPSSSSSICASQRALR
jgi:hypothetical protein